MVYYKVTDKSEKFSEQNGFKASEEYVAPNFLTTRGIEKLEHGTKYIAAEPTYEMISKEMSRREKKEYEKNK